ncbi:MBL fold metallo-hydrolase RNA specificity domain-containing protein [Alteromonas sp. 009811495]|uniref:MBL fold metallo-hydrolase RNA specificity domain-containing protein n=1 Tax=Alteromonas sp. 009811495 TaxID=3002962 RepID=UPI00237DD5BA|nr:MBL fold metallo-hydrolase [Alteromonas sp. 009811495]WDT85413.1 MBL fold metallo-hydrolase [Alteromonas sp. 009811495]
MATLTFLGAVEGVTGSMYLLETTKSKVLLDCGLYQGKREEEAKNSAPLPIDVKNIDAVVLSHAHLDHSGRLPILVREGYAGPIFMTRPTADLIEVLLKDAASLQERDAEWENKRRKRSGKALIEPLFREGEVEGVMTLTKRVRYQQVISITNDITVNFAEAGHILGSAIIELVVEEEGTKKKLVFSGDLGNSQAALLRDPEVITEADILLIESTYGDRNHRSMEETLDEFEKVILQASQNGGNILIPSFAVGRTQEIIFRLGELYQQGKLRHQKVYLDSPMAIAVTEIYHRYQDVYNDEDLDAIEEGAHKIHSRNLSLHSLLPILSYTTSTEESIALNKLVSGAIIIAGSGMCNGGRIRHHLKQNLWRRQSHVIFVGFQAVGTPGRLLVDGAKRMKIVGEDIAVNASIHTLGGFSAHASQAQLIDWLSNFANTPRVFLVHGEDNAKLALQKAMLSKGYKSTIPALNQRVEF